MIDNFDIVRDNILKFDKEGEFYMVIVLRRRKDIKGQVVEGVNEDNRLIKHYFVYEREYFERKRQAIVNLCIQNNARAYVLPQRRSHDLVMWALHNKTGEVLKSGAKNTHFDHLIRTCVAGIHEVPPNAKWHKRWVIDIDTDDKNTVEVAKAWRQHVGSHIDDVNLVRKYAHWLYQKIALALGCMEGKRPAEASAYMQNPSIYHDMSSFNILPTPHGWHIITPPFNRDQKMMESYFGGGCPKQEWIKPDAMAMLYAPDTI